MTRWRIERHPLVLRDVRRIARCLLDHTSEARVRAKIGQLERDVTALGDNPHKGTRYDDILGGLRAIPSSDKGVIAFQVLEARRTVRILSITWAGENWQGRVVERDR